jgi:hypothetical protein
VLLANTLEVLARRVSDYGVGQKYQSVLVNGHCIWQSVVCCAGVSVRRGHTFAYLVGECLAVGGLALVEFVKVLIG